ncbi:hypothetical protein Tco_0490698 [Tanacetum coccineum]
MPSSTNIFSIVSTPTKASSTNPINTASIPVSIASPHEGLSLADPIHSEEYDSKIPPLEDIYQNSTDGIFTTSSFDVMRAGAVVIKVSHLSVVKRIFRYLKGKPKLGLWYPRVSSFDLESYLDSDYAGANLDRKSTTGGCQFLGRRLISGSAKSRPLWLLLLIEENMLLLLVLWSKFCGIRIQMLDNGVQLHEHKTIH